VGLALTIDGLWWLRRRGAVRCVVNTQIGNEAAQALYLRAGFKVEPSELRVLRYRLPR
jgi:RimJ/RimL family protein N-acetyltransferase